MRVTISMLTALALASSALPAATLTITTENSPPSSMRQGEQIGGRETDKVRAILAASAIDYKIDMLPWKRAYYLALSQPDTCAYSTSRTPEREKLLKWVGPIERGEWILYARAGHRFKLKTLEDARLLRIGTYNGDVRDEYLRSRGFLVDSAQTDAANPKKLLAGRIDLWAVGVRAGTTPLAQFEEASQIVPVLTFNQIKVYLACNLSVPDPLIDRMNAALAALRRDGSILRIERKYDNWPEVK